MKDLYRWSRSIVCALGYYALYLCLPALLMSIGALIRDYTKSMDEFFTESGNFYTVLGFALSILFFRRRCKKRGTTLSEEVALYPKKVKPKKGLILFAFGMTASLAISAIITILPDGLKAGYQSATGNIFNNTDLLLAIFSVAFFAPLMEEIIFRGFMFTRLLEGFSERVAVISVTVLFALPHLNVIWILYAFGCGLMLAYISLKEDNIAYSVILHMGFNLPAVLNYFIMQSNTLTNALYGSKLLIVLYGIIGAAGAILLWRCYQMKEEEAA